MTDITKTETLVDGLCFGEGPRWHNDRLYFSDMHGRTVYALDASGNLEIIVHLEDDEPSGLGWLPDGRMLIVSMRNRKLLVLDCGKLTEFADLSSIATYHCNDMVTDLEGRSYVGNFGYDLHSNAEFQKAALILVHADGTTELAADGLSFPNGTVITPDGKTLIVGESFGARLTAFDINSDGSLTNRREWAKMDGATCRHVQGRHRHRYGRPQPHQPGPILHQSAAVRLPSVTAVLRWLQFCYVQGMRSSKLNAKVQQGRHRRLK